MAHQKRMQVVITTMNGKDILTYLRLIFPPYKNQPIDMYSISVDQFPYDGKTGMFKPGLLYI